MRPEGCAPALRCQVVSLCQSSCFPSNTESAVEGNAVLIGNIDNVRGLIVNFNLLFSMTANLVGSVCYDFVNRIVQDLRREFLGIGVHAYIL